MHTVDELKEGEVWKSPPSLNKWWVEVSNLGRIRTLPHRCKFVHKGQSVERVESGRVRKLAKDKRGRLLLFTEQKAQLVHRLVAECFVENPNPRKYNFVFFKNGDVTDCRAINLQWGDKNDKGWLIKGKYTKHLIMIYDKGMLMGEYFGLGEAADALGCTKQAVDSAMKRGGLCKGFVVRYKNRGDKASPVKNINEGRIKKVKSTSIQGTKR